MAKHDSRGFALIIVLWTLVLIAFITASLMAAGRTEIRIADNLAANAVTNAAAAGAVSRTIFQLLDADPKRRRRLDGEANRLTIGNCRVTVRVSDEAARINPNEASPTLLTGLLQVTGSDPATARRVAAAIGEWVGAAGAARTQNAMISEYREAGRDYAPPGAPLETLGELRRVLGMTPAIYAKISPHLSLFAPALPVAQDAEPVVAAALAALSNNAPARPAPPDIDPAGFTARIEVAAEGPGSARAKVTVIARVIPRSAAYTILAWHDGASAD